MMADARFFITSAPLTAHEAAALAGAALDGPDDAPIRRAAAFDDEDPSDAVVYITDEKQAETISGARPPALLVATPALAAHVGPGPLVATPSPKLAFAKIAAALHRERPQGSAAGVDPSASLGDGVRVHPTAIIGEDAVIGAGCEIGPFVVIGPGVVIGADSVIGAGSFVACCIAGARLILGPGARVGQQGFGFAPESGALVRLPQLGRVMIGDGVEIGANTTVDRGALGDTVLGDNVKIDNLCQIGHNVRLGRGCVLAAQVGIAGSVIVGDGVVMGGQAGVADHLAIGDGAQIAARAGLISDVPAGETWAGYPARPIRTWLRDAAAVSRLRKKKKISKDDD